MNKKYGQQKQNSYKSIIFWSIIGLITLIFIILVIVRFAQSRTVNSYDSLEQLQGEKLFEASDKRYIVFVYDSEREKNVASDEFDKLVFNYITFAKRHSNDSDVYKIYGFDITDPENKKVVISEDSSKEERITNVDNIEELLIKSNNIPMLLVINGNKVSDFKDSNNAISDYLQNIIDQNK